MVTGIDQGLLEYKTFHSITTMQLMLDICSHEANLLDFTFNTVKSMAMRIGPRYKLSLIHISEPTRPY